MSTKNSENIATTSEIEDLRLKSVVIDPTDREEGVVTLETPEENPKETSEIDTTEEKLKIPVFYDFFKSKTLISTEGKQKIPVKEAKKNHPKDTKKRVISAGEKLQNLEKEMKKMLISAKEKVKFHEKELKHISRVQNCISWLKMVGVQPQFLKFELFSEEKMDLIESLFDQGGSRLQLPANDRIDITKILSKAHEVSSFTPRLVCKYTKLKSENKILRDHCGKLFGLLDIEKELVKCEKKLAEKVQLQISLERKFPGYNESITAISDQRMRLEGYISDLKELQEPQDYYAKNKIKLYISDLKENKSKDIKVNVKTINLGKTYIDNTNEPSGFSSAASDW